MNAFDVMCVDVVAAKDNATIIGISNRPVRRIQWNATVSTIFATWVIVASICIASSYKMYIEENYAIFAFFLIF
jgi:hypothetical protein